MEDTTDTTRMQRIQRIRILPIRIQRIQRSEMQRLHQLQRSVWRSKVCPQTKKKLFTKLLGDDPSDRSTNYIPNKKSEHRNPAGYSYSRDIYSYSRGNAKNMAKNTSSKKTKKMKQRPPNPTLNPKPTKYTWTNKVKTPSRLNNNPGILRKPTLNHDPYPEKKIVKEPKEPKNIHTSSSLLSCYTLSQSAQVSPRYL